MNEPSLLTSTFPSPGASRVPCPSETQPRAGRKGEGIAIDLPLFTSPRSPFDTRLSPKMQLYDDLPRPQGTHADPAFTTYAELPSTQSYPPSYRTDNLPPDPDGQPYNQAAAYSQQHILPFSSVPPPPAEGASLVKRLSLLLPAQDPNYKSPEQIAEEDRTLDAEEKEMLKRGMFDWNEMRRWRFWIRKEWWGESFRFPCCFWR